METSNKLTGEQLSLWTSFAVDTHASHLAQQESEREQMTQDTCGHGLEQPLASYDPDTQSWRMSEDISLWGDYKLLASLPKSGMTRNGVLYQQPGWVRPIDASESLLWPTPLTNDNKAGKKKVNPNLVDAVMMRPNLGEPAPTTQEFKEHRMFPTPRSSSAMAEDLDVVRERLENGKQYKSRLEEAIAMWPTPTTQEVEHPQAELTETGRRKSKNGKTSHSLGLADAVQMWPTPTATEHKYRLQGSSQASKNLNALHGGKLNPTWVEWLMGFPIGWTDLKD